jgi:hypothetical protein
MEEESVPTYNIKVYQGETWHMDMTLKDSNGAPIPLTGYTAKVQVRSKVNGPVLLEMSSPSAGITITPAIGKVDMDLTATQTEALNFTSAIWDLFLTLGAARTPWLKGKWEVVLSSTKAV